MKLPLTMLFLVAAQTVFGQEKTILNLLNTALNNEARYVREHPAFAGDSLVIVESFSINESKVLSMAVKRRVEGGGYDIIRQEVPLNKVNRILKDINVILGSVEEGVTSTTTSVAADGATETHSGSSDMFFLQLASGLQGEQWQSAITKAFEKAGYHITKDYWAD